MDRVSILRAFHHAVSMSRPWNPKPNDWQKLARRRFQTGNLTLRGTKIKTWFGRWVEYVILPDGTEKRVDKSRTLGTIRDFPTKRLAMRELARILEPINSTAYKPKNLITFGDVAEEWKTLVLPTHKGSTQMSEVSHLAILKEYFGSVPIAEINTKMLQQWVSSLTAAPKTIRNYKTTMRMIWRSAKAWEYVDHNPFEDLILPKKQLVDQPSLTPEQAREIIRKADEPFKSVFWLVAETGMRGGEVCGLFVEDVDLKTRIIHVRRSAWRGKIQTPKTGNAVRQFLISENLAQHLKQFIESRLGKSPPHGVASPDLLFPTSTGTAYDNHDIVQQHLRPMLEKMGLYRKRMGLHAMRHRNISAMDSLNTPLKVRQERVGHSSFSTTFGYTHSFSADHRTVADQLGAMFDPNIGNSRENPE